MDASNFGGTVCTRKLFTCMVGVEGEVPCQSPRYANMWPPGTFFGPPLRPLLRGSWRGQGCSTQLRGGAAGRLAQIEWTKPKKAMGAVQKAMPIFICHFLGPLLILLHSEGLQILQLLGSQMNPLSFIGGGCDLWGCGLRWERWYLGANHHHHGGLLWLHMGN